MASLKSPWEAQRWKACVALGGKDEGLKPRELCECLEQPALQGSLYTLVSRPPSASAPPPHPDEQAGGLFPGETDLGSR